MPSQEQEGGVREGEREKASSCLQLRERERETKEFMYPAVLSNKSNSLVLALYPYQFWTQHVLPLSLGDSWSPKPDLCFSFFAKEQETTGQTWQGGL